MRGGGQGGDVPSIEVINYRTKGAAVNQSSRSAPSLLIT